MRPPCFAKRTIARLILLSFYLGIYPWPGQGTVSPARADVSPLHMITRQVKKGNMLVVLDTSGSMTGVPGEPFDAATELGVDCDLGDDCREVTQTGECLMSKQPLTGLPRLCSNNAQCRVGSCKFGSDPCLQDADCPTVGSVCSKDGRPCQYNSDCSPQSSTCKISGASCSSVQPCAPAGRCSDGNAVCNNPGGNCALRYCSDKPAQICSADADCQTSQSNTLPTAGLVAHYKLDEGTGTTAADSAGTPENLTFVSPEPTWTTGKSGGALEFPNGGAATRASGGFADFTGLNAALTIAAWIYRPATPPSWDGRIVDIRQTGGSDLIKLWQGPSNKYLCGGLFGTGHCAGGVLTDGAWQHVAMTWDGSSVRFYVNGILSGTPESKAGPSGAYTIEKVSVGSSFQPMKGKVDEVRIYNRALSSTELLQILGTEQPSGSGLVGHWNFNEGSGTTAADATPNASTATFTGAVWGNGKEGSAADINWGRGLIASAKGTLAAAPQQFSYAAWVYPRACTYGAIIDSDALPVVRVTNGTGTCKVQFSPQDPAVSDMFSATDVSLNQWSHIAVTYDSATTSAKVYLNGAVVATKTDMSTSIIKSAPTKIMLGVTDAGNGGYLDGFLDDARVYYKALSAAEVSALATGAGSGPVVHLAFDGNVQDQSGNNFNGTLSGSGSYVAGPSGQALKLDGTSGCVVIPAAMNSRLDIRGPFSIGFHVYRDNSAEHKLVFRKSPLSWNPTIGISTDMSSTGRVNVWFKNFAYQMADADEAIAPGQWHHVLHTWDGSTFNYYRDGVLARSYSGPPTPDATPLSNGNAWGVGCEVQDSGPKAFSAIRVDDFRVYDRAVSASEAVTLAGSSASAHAGLLAHWKFDEGSGTSVADQSGNGRTLQLYCTDSNHSNMNQTGTNCPNNMPSFQSGHTGAASDRSVGFLYWNVGQTSGGFLDTSYAGKLTISAWVRKATAQAATAMIVHRQAGSNTNTDDLALGTSSNKAFLKLGSASLSDTLTMVAGQWYHLVGTYDGSTLRLYRDGAQVASTALNNATLTGVGQPLTIGAGREFDKPGEYADMDISDFAIWSKALTATEVTALKAGTMPTSTGTGATCKPNLCVSGDNSCNVSLNTCQGGQVNQCMGVNTTDTCQINSSNTGPAKMCRFEQTFCAVDGHCSRYSGDECVPATSRSVVAKRVLRNVLLNNHDIMNFGLMGFSQGSPDGTTWDRTGEGVVDSNDKDGWPDDYYFPYYKLKTTSGIEFQDRYITKSELERYGCYIKSGGSSNDDDDDDDDGSGVYSLAPTCTISGSTYDLRQGINARYSVFRNGTFVEIDQPYCGDTCVITSVPQGWLLHGTAESKQYQDARGTGRFAGAHFRQTIPVGDYDPLDQPVFRKQYDGRNISIAGQPYVYFKPRNDYYWNPMAGTNRPPIKGSQCANRCGVACGGNWDPNLWPMMDVSDDPAQAKANLQKMLPLLEKAEDGGFMHWERGPVGCALINDFSDGLLPAPADRKKHSAWHYLEDVKSSDKVLCRDNFVLLITDGETNGPGDVDANGYTTCDNPACRVQWDDPNATVGASCQCKSVINALKLRKSAAQGGLNVKTYVIGFSPDAVIGVPATVNENIARAGGTCRAPRAPGTNTDDKCMFLATNETELQEAIQSVIFDAIKGSYSTTPASAVSGTQQDDKLTPGAILFDARVDFPTWRGHLLAYDTKDVDAATGQPKLMWDAGGPQFFPDINDTVAYKDWTKWKSRRVYTSAGGNMIQVQIEPLTGKILNRAELFALGLGSTEDESERIAQWMLGDPRQRNKAVLGAFVNSTPIEVGAPGLSGLPGGKRFHEDNKTRTSLVYAAGDDGLLHAFFTRDTTVSGVQYKGGQEAFAYVPPEMLRVLTKLYAQGGQKADPRQHVFGLTSSPKVKNVCWTNCNDEATAVWKTIMVMSDGWGGTESFMLDVTSPFVGGNFGNPPVKVLWHTDTVMPSDKTLYDAYLGRTVSVPAFYYGKSSTKNDHRVVFASGYASNPATSAAQGITLVNVAALNGRLLDGDTVAAASCSTVKHTTLTDVAAARNFDFREQQQMLGAFFGDTWGNLWRYVPGMEGADNNTAATGSLSLLKGFGCSSPLHFSPTVVQPDRDDPLNHPGEVFLVQVTNSALDPQTEKFAPSRMIIRKEKRTSMAGGLASDPSWVTGGQIELVAGEDTLCGSLDPSGGSGSGSCSEKIPAHARPTSTPLAILKADGTGFLIISLWYAPPQAICGTGRSYLALHEININSNQVLQRAGIGLVAEPVTSAVIVDKKIVYTDSQGKVHDVTSQLNQTFLAGGAISDVTRNGGLRFQQTGWTEVP